MIDRDNGKGRFEHEHRLAEHEHEHDWWVNNGRGIPAMDHGKCSGRQSPSPGVESQTRIRRGTRHAIRGRGSWTYALSCLAVHLAFCQLPPPDAGDDVMWNYEAAMDPSRAGRRLSRGGTMMTFPLDCAR